MPTKTLVRASRRIVTPCLISLAFLLTPSLSVAQVITGSILGIVRDETSALVPGVTITASNANTGQTRTTTTGHDGSYSMPLLPVGVYAIRAELSGFKTQERPGIELPIDAKVRVDFTLNVGQISETVTVEALAPLLSRDSSEMGQLIENRRVTQLPLNGRQFVQLALLAPGVVPEVRGTLSSPLALSGFSVNANGTRYDSNMFLLDGVPIRDSVFSRLTISPSIDAIEEFKVHTSNYSAEFGGQGGAQINVSIKSGGNVVHGTAYEFLRNAALDSRNFFDLEKPPFRQNQFGASVGGPVKRNRTFFFGNYEGQRIFKGVSIGAAVPTDAMRQGDFRGQGPVVDPLTGARFSFNGQLDVIPPDRIAPYATALLEKIPLATSPGLGRNFVGFGNRDVTMDQFNVRFDHTISESQSLMTRFSFSNVEDLEPIPGVLLGSAAANPLRPPGFGQTSTQKSRNLAAQYTRILSPRLINQFRFGYNYLDAGQVSENASVNFGQQFGFQGINPPPLGAGYPIFTIVGFSTFGDANTQLFTGDNDFSFHDDLTFTRGRHGFKFGGSYTRVRVLTQFVFNTAGQFTYVGAFTQNPFADFLLGYNSVANALTGDPLLHGRGHRVGGYVQDDWRVTPSLTLNLGLRYDLNTPYTERDNKLANFAPEIPGGGFVVAGSPGHVHPSADPSRFPGLPITTAEELGYPGALTNTDSNNFAPRIGFAYSATDTAVIRGGYGLFYSNGIQGGRFGIMGFNPPFTGLKLFLNFNPANPIPVQQSLVTPAANIVLGQGPARDLPDAYIHQWNLSVQKQLGPAWMVEGTYVGARGHKLEGTLLPNQPDASPAPLQGRLVFPNVGPDQIVASAVFKSWFNSFVLRAERRYADGLSFSASYTWAKSLDTNGGSLSNSSGGGAPQYSGNIAAEKGRSQFDVRHRLVLNGVFDLPFGDGRRFASGATGVAGVLASGWQVNFILLVQSGMSLTPLLPTDNSNTGGNNDQPNLVGDPNTGPRTANQWFNTSAFVRPPFGQFGNSGRGIIDGPGFQTLDLSVVKRTSLTNDIRLEFRLETFNLLNHTNFDLPSRVFGPTFGQIFSARDARELQFGLKLIF